ncbi:MAG: DUF2779 domain-containing protein [Spirosomataceae bacterium]
MQVFSKTTFKLGLECPNKLYFANDKSFANQKIEDSFLQYLASGGFQVEALARLHYPNGKTIDAASYEYELAATLTKNALTEENTVLFDAAFLVDGFYSRCDIIEKKGNKLRLIEVKAKTFDPKEEHTFKGVRGGLVATWKPYLFDLAFQKQVIQWAYPDLQVEAFLFMADKTKVATIDGLNQLFRVKEGGASRKDIETNVTSLADIGSSVLTEINMNELIDKILEDKHACYAKLPFSVAVQQFKKNYFEKTYAHAPIAASACKACEFKASQEEKANGLQSGFEYCFKKQLNWQDSDFNRPNILEIWNFRADSLIQQGRLFLDEISEEDLKVEYKSNQISPSERRWIQVQKARSGDTTVYVEKEGLKEEMKRWTFPLHFIDFETSTVALPFTAGRRPYEQVAFQFSHHTYHEDGIITHTSEFISHTPGEFPNFLFARALKAALGNDLGSIFRFASHENSILNAIIKQLRDSNEPDKDELIAFLQTITAPTNNSAEKWTAERSMIDLNKIIKEYYYNPYTKGSISIKAVLPAALKVSTFLQKKYSKSLNQINISSKNFPKTHIWLTQENGEVVNPYKMLPPLFQEWSEIEKKETQFDSESIADGGAALAAYAKLQYQNLTDRERNEITSGLLKYCELDTLAMVMIYEHLKELTE